MHSTNFLRKFLPLFYVVFIVGCSSERPLMPTPNLFIGAGKYPANEIPKNLQNPQIELLYVTDRTQETDPQAIAFYGAARSDAAAYGTVTVEISNASTWQDLVSASETKDRKRELLLHLGPVQERARFPPTPYPFSIVDGEIVDDEASRAAYQAAALKFRTDIVDRLERGQRDEVVLFIHGFNNTFQSSAFVLADIWHFIGRRGVPILYSWPAASGGLFGYFVDRESGEFTIFHLKQFLRLLGDIPQVRRLHIIAHSRGTDVMTTALRELVIESRAAGRKPFDDFRIANLVLAAPDLDFDIVRQRLIAEKFGPAIEQITIYTNQQDSALDWSEFLMSGVRFGRLDSTNLGQTEGQIFNTLKNVNIVNVENETSVLGHSYFRENPGVSSDIAILIRHGSRPGDAKRPLVHRVLNFWDLLVGYPGAIY